MNDTTNDTTKMPTPDEAFERYRGLVENADDQAPALLVVGTDDGEAMFALLDLPVPMQDALAALRDQVLKLAGTPRWVMLHSEAWSASVDAQEQDKRRLSDRVADGETFAEVAITTVLSLDSSYAVIAPFIRGSGVTWGERQIVPAEGGLGDVLTTYFD